MFLNHPNQRNPMKILIISQCTGPKAVDHPNRLTMADFQLGAVHVNAMAAALPANVHLPAGEMYTGQQHILLKRGIAVARANGIQVDLRILSAGYGLIPENQIIVPYEATFKGMTMGQLHAWARSLGVPQAFGQCIQNGYDFGMVLLGEKYLRACQIGPQATFGIKTLLLGSAAAIGHLPQLTNLRCRVAGPAEAHLLGGAGSTGIKGKIARRTLEKLAPLNPVGRTNLVNQIMNPNIDPLTLI